MHRRTFLLAGFGTVASLWAAHPRDRGAPHDGYFEGRLPFPIHVDETWYMRQYPDVAESVRRGILPSAQAHFDEDGYREGRLPFGM